MNMPVLIGYESSGVVREAFRARGFDAWSCDLQPADDASPYHLQMPVQQAVTLRPWVFGVFHPTCTYLCSSGLHWNKRVPGRAALTEQAVDEFRWLLDLPFPKAVENPRGCISTRIRRPDQEIQPWQFGEDASKLTCLWLTHGTPPVPIDPSLRVAGRIVNGKERWANQTDSGQNRLAPSADRWKQRSRTYPGFARAWAQAWGDWLADRYSGDLA